MKFSWLLSFFAVLVFSAGNVSSEPLPNLLGEWSGKFTMVTSDATSTGITHYEFTEQMDNVVKGENRWQVQSRGGDQGNAPLPRGTNSFLGVIAEDGTIYLVVDGDTAIRRLRLTDRDTINFVEFAGGENQVVVSVELTRKKAGSVSASPGENAK